MSQILRDLNKLAAKVGAPVVGKNISEQVRALSTFWDETSHGANIAERVNELAHSHIGEGGTGTLIEKTITSNDTYNAVDDNADGYSKVTVNVPSAEPTLITKSIIQNGTYNASSDSADGYSSVTVEVPAISPYADDALVEASSAVGTKKVITTSEWIGFPAQGTYEACFKYTSVDTPNGRIFHLGNGVRNMLVLDIQSNAVPEVGINDAWTGERGRSAVQTLLSPNTFYTVAFTIDCTNNVIKMYVNGAEAETIDVPCSSLPDQAYDVTYLLKSDTSNRNTYGNLYSYRRHTRLLTAAEILKNYQEDLRKYGQN